MLATKQNVVPITTRIEEALASLSNADYVRIYRQASYFLPGTGLHDPQELFNEAIKRTLEETRIWPCDVPFKAYIHEVMSSISDGYRNLVRHDREILANDRRNVNADPDDDLIDEFGSENLAIDNVLIDRESQSLMAADLKAIEDHFENDEDVTLIIMAMEDKVPPRDMESEYGMSVQRYEYARKKLRRGIDRLFPGRRKI